MTFSLNKSDYLGIISSTLCLIHCLATPFLFVAQAHVAIAVDAKPLWWSSLDILFLGFSSYAVYRSSSKTSKKWVGIALWISLVALVFIIVNEKLGWLSIPEVAIYIPAFGLIIFHLYAGLFCQCQDDACCVN